MAHGTTKPFGIHNQVLAVMLTTSSSEGGDLLFRYPCDDSHNKLEKGHHQSDFGENHFSVKSTEAYHEVTNHRSYLGLNDGRSMMYSDKVLSNFLAVHAQMSDKPFDVKVDDVQFVGFPVALKHSREKTQSTASKSTTVVNVVFALPETVHEKSKACYLKLSEQIGMALKHEERRCCFFCSQKKLMVDIIDKDNHRRAKKEQDGDRLGDAHSNSPSLKMLEERVSLPLTLKNIFHEVSEKGVVLELMNNWTEINFCLPIKVHNIPFENKLRITEDDIDNCIALLRPYHAVMLLIESRKLIDSLPIDSSPALIRLLRVATEIKNLQELAADCDLELSQVFRLVSHLVYWAKAAIIYPLCEQNVYVLAPNAPLHMNSELSKEFKRQFPNPLNSNCLTEVLSEFSLPTPLVDHQSMTDSKSKKGEKIRMVVWMLKKRLLIQLHTYLLLRPNYLADTASKTSAWSVEAGSSAPTTSLSAYKGDSKSIKRILNEEGKEMLKSIADPESEPLFSSLCAYFDGKHHVEEIMFNENINRSVLLTVIDKYQPLLYKMQAPDPATSYHIKY